MTKAEAGRLGGQATARLHGKSHMATIGRKGAEATWSKYALRPVGVRGWAMVERKTGKVIAIVDF